MANGSRMLPASSRHSATRVLVGLLHDGRLDRHDFLRVRLAELRLAVAVDVGTRMDGDVLMDDIARHARGAGENHLLGFNLAVDGAGDFDFLAVNGSLHLRAGADLHGLAADITIDFAV